MADFLADYASAQDGTVRLYFPSAQEFRIMNFLSYLNSKHGDAMQNLTFASPLPFPDDLCVSFRPYRCESDPTPRKGDLVVHLPDDAARVEAAPGTRSTLFRSRWLPFDMPSVAGGAFYVEAPLYSSGATMPDGWLVALVELQLS
jgi:hypothetical protein